MSLGILIKGPEGLVLAADSRVTLGAQPPQGPGILVNFDNATKLLSFRQPHTFVGAVTYGDAAIGLRTASSFVPEFEATLPSERKPVADFAQLLSDFFMARWRAEMPMPPEYKESPMTFVVGGFDERQPYGQAFVIDIPIAPAPREVNPGVQFGITWGGQRDFVDRLLRGYHEKLPDVVAKALSLTKEQKQTLLSALSPLDMKVPLQAMALQDCVNLAIFFIRTTMDAQNLTVGVRGVGGPIDVAVITGTRGIEFVQRKKIVGEGG
jgi:20S proteasome alpha/beta subunit